VNVPTPGGGNSVDPGKYNPVDVTVAVGKFASPCCGGGSLEDVDSEVVTVSGGKGLNCPGGSVGVAGVSQSVE